MNSKVLGVVLSAVLVGAIGYWIGASRGGAPRAAPACAGTATLEYDTTTQRLTLHGNTAESKVLLVDFERVLGGDTEVCWDFRALGGTAKFRKLRIDTTPPSGANGKPILVGDANFQGGAKSRAWLRYAGSTPIWTTVTLGGKPVEGVRWSFGIEAELLDGTTIPYDPDIVIIKPRI